MNKTIQEQLSYYLERLQREQAERGARDRVVSSYTDAIGRCYDLLGETENALKYFVLSSEACLRSLKDPKGASLSRPDERGHDCLTCARILWRANDNRAKTYFQQALEEYQKGYNWEVEGVRIRCWHESIYCLIFSEDYEAAVATAKTSDTLEQNYPPQKDPGYLTKRLITVIENCQKNSIAAHIESLSILEEFFRIEKSELYWQNPPSVVDVYEFVKRKLAELQA